MTLISVPLVVTSFYIFFGIPMFAVVVSLAADPVITHYQRRQLRLDQARWVISAEQFFQMKKCGAVLSNRRDKEDLHKSILAVGMAGVDLGSDR